MFCTVNIEGEIMLIEKSESEMILVVKGWQKFTRSSDPIEAGVSTGGYLSQGYSKYAFRVCSVTVTLFTYLLAHAVILTGCSRICASCTIPGTVSRDLQIN
jgi:hypothetical protein